MTGVQEYTTSCGTVGAFKELVGHYAGRTIVGVMLSRAGSTGWLVGWRPVGLSVCGKICRDTHIHTTSVCIHMLRIRDMASRR
jgi:hypothetical protein